MGIFSEQVKNKKPRLLIETKDHMHVKMRSKQVIWYPQLLRNHPRCLRKTSQQSFIARAGVWSKEVKCLLQAWEAFAGVREVVSNTGQPKRTHRVFWKGLVWTKIVPLLEVKSVHLACKSHGIWARQISQGWLPSTHSSHLDLWLGQLLTLRNLFF